VSIALNVNVNRNSVSISIITKKIPSTNFDVKSRILPTSTPKLLKNVRSDTVLELSKTKVKNPQPIISAANKAAPKNPNICMKETGIFSIFFFSILSSCSFKKIFSQYHPGAVLDNTL
jgi:hypothetical protein